MNKHYEIWTDGSYKDNVASYAYVIYSVADKKKIRIGAGSGVLGDDPSRQIAGEIAGATYALKAFEGCITADDLPAMVIVCHDYMGIQAWPLRQWKANNPNAKRYVAAYDRYVADGIDIQFRHVKGHTGVKENEEVDKMAAEAILNRKKINERDQKKS